MVKDFIFVLVTEDTIESSDAYYDACKEQYLWGPKSKTWGHLKPKYKRLRVGFGQGYGVLKVNYETFKEITPGWYTKTVFKQKLSDLIRGRVLKLKKTGWLRVSIGDFRETKLEDGRKCFKVSFGLTFTPRPMSELYEMGHSCNEYVSEWMIGKR